MWIKGYMRNIGVATRFTAKCWALRDGLLLAAQLGITHIVVELDALTIVNLVSANTTSNRLYSPLLNNCRYFWGNFIASRSTIPLKRRTGVLTILLKLAALLLGILLY